MEGDGPIVNLVAPLTQSDLEQHLREGVSKEVVGGPLEPVRKAGKEAVSNHLSKDNENRKPPSNL